MRKNRVWFIWVFLGALGACDDGVTLDDTQQKTEMDIVGQQSALDSTRHYNATLMGVAGWVNGTVAERLKTVSRLGDTDSYWKKKSESHFDNCYWQKSVERLWDLQDDMVDKAILWNNTNNDYYLDRMYESFGFALHIVQDFYAHSNWVETHSSGTLASFNSTTPPSNWYSGRYDNSGDAIPTLCDSSVPHHDEMNKDHAETGDHEEAFIDAAAHTSVLLQEFSYDILSRLGASVGNTLLSRIGFLTNPPSLRRSRTDYTRSVTLEGKSWGRWGQKVFCRPGSYVAAFRQKVESHQGSGDDTALNAITFYCRDSNGSWTDYLNPWEGLWGDGFGSYSICSTSAGYITGGGLKVEPYQGSGDDTSANAGRFWCQNGTRITASNDGPWGNWTARKNCGSGEAVCGVQTRVEAHIGSEDDTAMNNLKLLCCSL